ncbi:MAG TPA: hypothetical protein VFA94_07890 [Acidimicrobiales bacterium]|nr:hypothetical protein [Acidimicrobiales bacterium]
MDDGRIERGQEPNTVMHALETSASEARLDGLLVAPVVRPEAVARARQLLASPSWCRAEEVAARLLDCMIGNRLP